MFQQKLVGEDIVSVEVKAPTVQQGQAVVKNGATPRVPGEQGLLSLQQVEQINAVINDVTGN